MIVINRSWCIFYLFILGTIKYSLTLLVNLIFFTSVVLENLSTLTTYTNYFTDVLNVFECIQTYWELKYHSRNF